MQGLNILQKPLFWFLFLFIGWGIYNSISFENRKKAIDSDGRGYYAFLPAVFLFNDPTYSASVDAENKHLGTTGTPAYIKETKNNKYYNNYFPGVALLELPFFLIATLISWLIGSSITGYSDLYTFFFYLGGLTYSILGVLLLRKSLFILSKENLWHTKFIDWFIILLFVCTPLLFYSIGTSLSHNFSFFLICWFMYLILQLKNEITLSRMITLGLVLGLITITRPTNLTCLLFIPFLLGSKQETIHFFKSIFKDHVLWVIISFISFLLVLSLVFLTWKWQSGSWLLWSYGGQGFNWLHPKVFELLIGFRTGLFWHTPIIILAIIGTWYLFRENKFKFLFWNIYFLVNLYVVSAWWCWDYATLFGPRAFTEHFVFFLLPLFFLFRKPQKVIIGAVFLIATLGIIRYFEKQSGFMQDQRFTNQNYFASLKFWKPENRNRWQTTTAVEPFGTLNGSTSLLIHSERMEISSTREYALDGEIALHNYPRNSNYYIKMKCDKNLISGNFEGVYFVVDAFSASKEKSYYLAIPIYNDKLERKDNWTNIQITDYVPDNFHEYDKLKCYIWNSNQSTFEIKNYECVLEVYN